MVSITLQVDGAESDLRALRPDDLAGVFRALDPDEPVTFSCNDEGNDRVLIIGLDGDLAYPEFLCDGTFYRIDSGDQEGVVEIALGGHWPEEYPKRNLVPREKALELLRQAADDMNALFDRYSWVE